MDGMKLFAIYLAVMNVLGVAVMWSDKRRARLHRVADSGEGALWCEPARGKRGNLGRNVFVPPQDEALVFCGRNAAHSGLPGGTCNLSGALICFITNCYRRYVFSD